MVMEILIYNFDERSFSALPYLASVFAPAELGGQ